MRTIRDAAEAWWFLVDHPMFKCDGVDHFGQCLDIEVVRVDPETESINSDDSRNTAVRVWLECGAWHKSNGTDDCVGFDCPEHDYRLDCGAPTFEEAIQELAKLVLEHYGDYEDAA